MTGRVQRARPPAGLKYDGRHTRCRDQSVALQKSPLGGWGPARELRNDDTRRGDPVKKGVVAARIEAVDTASKKGDGVPFARESGSVRHPIDSVSRPRHDRVATINETCGRLHRYVLAVARCCSRPHKGDGGPVRLEKRGITANPQRNRPVRSEIVDAARPFHVARHEESQAETHGLVHREEGGVGDHARTPPIESRHKIGCAEPRISGRGRRRFSESCHEPVDRPSLHQSRERRLGTEHGNDGARRPVPRLGDPSPRSTGEPVDKRIPVEGVVGATRGTRQLPKLGQKCGLRHTEDRHQVAFLRYSARPICSAVGRSTSSRSAIVHATRSTRS